MVRIHSKIITDYPAASTIYYLARQLDVRGSGWCRIDLKVASEQLGIKPASVVQRARKAQKVGLLYEVIKQKNILFVKYISLSKAKALVDGVHASCLVNLETLKSLADYKLKAYESALIRQQMACRRAVNEHCSNSRFIFDPTNKQSFQRTKRCEFIKEAGKTVFLKRGTNSVGASQITVASKLDKSRSTVVRYAQKIPHTQVFIRQSFSKLKPSDSIGSFLSPKFYVYEHFASSGRKIRKLYRRMPNIYFSDLDVHKESSQPHKSIVSPADQLSLNDSSINYVLHGQKTWYAKSTEDQLRKYCGVERLRELSHVFLLYYRGRTTEKVNQLGSSEIIEMLSVALNQLDEFQKETFKLMLRRVRKNKNISPLPGNILNPIIRELDDHSKQALKEVQFYVKFIQTEEFIEKQSLGL